MLKNPEGESAGERSSWIVVSKFPLNLALECNNWFWQEESHANLVAVD